jgi:hypothetical protein
MCLVYNGTSLGLNAHLWAPWFALPDICTFLRVDLTHYMERGEGALEVKIHMVRWGRCLVGGTCYPYQTGQGMVHSK